MHLLRLFHDDDNGDDDDDDCGGGDDDDDNDNDIVISMRSVTFHTSNVCQTATASTEILAYLPMPLLWKTDPTLWQATFQNHFFVDDQH